MRDVTLSFAIDDDKRRLVTGVASDALFLLRRSAGASTTTTEYRHFVVKLHLELTEETPEYRRGKTKQDYRRDGSGFGNSISLTLCFIFLFVEFGHCDFLF